MADELENHKTKNGESYEFFFIPKDSFSIKNFHRLATSKYVFLSDNFFALGFMKFHDEVVISQLWHAPGVFKRFGYDLVDDDSQKLMKKFGKRINYLFVSSKNIVDTFSHNFAMDKSKTFPLGIPRVDFYDKCPSDFKDRLKEDFEEKYPFIRGKKIVLYAPTFRENPKYNSVFDYFNIEKFNQELGDDYALFVKLHPNYKKFMDENHKIDLDDLNGRYSFVDCSSYKNEQELFLLSDVLITDYSSVMVEYTILNKPIVLFAYDLDNYLQNERGFYFDYKEKVPGNIALDFDEVIRILKEEDFDFDRLSDFAHYQFDYFDGNSSKRILDFVLEK